MPKNIAAVLHPRVRKVYNSLMKFRTRFSKKAIPPGRIEKMRREFAKAAGPSMRLLVDLMENAPNISLVVKNAEGRIMYTNKFNADISGWRSKEEMIGYTSEELYEPGRAAVYANRDREVMETGVPIVERLYGFVADRSDSLNCVTVRPVVSVDGRRIGTATVYWRAQRKMSAANWYEPIRKATAFLNRHYAENVSVAELARVAHYSPAQFRRRFSEIMQMAPSEYIATVRINNAKTLLRTTDRRVADIAADVGFFDHSHFIRTFRAVVGTTPAKYRRSMFHSTLQH